MLAIALVIAGGVAVCVMSLVAYSSLNATRELYYQQNQFAEVFAPLKRAPRQALHRVSEIPGVVRLSARVEAAANWKFLASPSLCRPGCCRCHRAVNLRSTGCLSGRDDYPRPDATPRPR